MLLSVNAKTELEKVLRASGHPDPQQGARALVFGSEKRRQLKTSLQIVDVQLSSEPPPPLRASEYLQMKRAAHREACKLGVPNPWAPEQRPRIRDLQHLAACTERLLGL